MNKILTIISLLILTVTTVSAVSTALCKGCHGKNFEKKAQDTSKVVRNLSKEEILKALKGYQNDSYGGVLKRVMKEQVSKFSDRELEELVEEIKK